jgi:hypothetical protein
VTQVNGCRPPPQQVSPAPPGNQHAQPGPKAGDAAAPAASLQSSMSESCFAEGGVAVSHQIDMRPNDPPPTFSAAESLSMIESYYGRDAGPGRIEREMSAEGYGTSPEDVAEYADSGRFRSEVKHGGTLNDLARNVDRGIPTMVLTGGSRCGGDQYMVVTGYQRNACGRITTVTVADSQGETREMRASELSRRWAAGGQTMVSVVPRHGSIVGTDGVARNARDISLPHDSVGPFLDDITGPDMDPFAGNAGADLDWGGPVVVCQPEAEVPRNGHGWIRSIVDNYCDNMWASLRALADWFR